MIRRNETVELVAQAKAAGERERQALHNEIGQLKIDMNKADPT